MAFEELKQRHAAMWARRRSSGSLAPWRRCTPRSSSGRGGRQGQRWLDVGCGTGELAFMAVEKGAEVTGADLSPVLVETARRQAAERGLDVTFEIGGAEAPHYPDESFDVVTPSVGAIFAPDHDAVAAEFARVCRPGGRLGLTAWTTDGGVDEFFEIIASYAPPPPADAGVPWSWGEPEYCHQLLGQHAVQVETPEEFWEDMSEGFGPIKSSSAASPPIRPRPSGATCSPSSTVSGRTTGSASTGSTTSSPGSGRHRVVTGPMRRRAPR